MLVKDVPLTKLEPYFRNPRNAAQAVPKVMRSIKEFGWRQPIVVDKNMVIIVGHARYLAAQRLGLAKVPVHVAADLSETKIKEYRLADNRSHEEATWDENMLGIELLDLKELGSDLGAIGFDEQELEKLLKTDDDKPDASPQLAGLSYSIVLRCFDEAEQKRLLEKFEKEGYECQALIS